MAADLSLVVIWNSWVGLENVNSGFTITGWTSHPVSNIFVFVKNFYFHFYMAGNISLAFNTASTQGTSEVS